MAKRLEIKVSAKIKEGADAFAESDMVSAAKEHVTALKAALEAVEGASDLTVEVKVVSPPEHRAPRTRKTTNATTTRTAPRAA